MEIIYLIHVPIHLGSLFSKVEILFIASCQVSCSTQSTWQENRVRAIIHITNKVIIAGPGDIAATLWPCTR